MAVVDADDGIALVEAAPLLAFDLLPPPPPLLHKVVKPAKGVITNPNGKSPHLRNVLLSVGKVWTVLRIMRGDINTL